MSESTSPRRPNILWICTDSQRWDTLGCYGNPHVRSPNVDRLAREGVLFENTFSQSPVCTPSRGAFLTGRYPVTNRLRQNGQVCPPDLRLITKVLAEQGYVCGLSGKLHLSACDNRLLLGREWWNHDDRLWFRGTEARIDDGYAEFHWDHAPGEAQYPSSDYTRWLVQRGVTPRRGAPPREDCRFVRVGRPSELHQATWCANEAISFVERYQDQPHPWLFSVNIFDPHWAFDPPPEFLEPYLDRLDEIPLPAYVEGELADKPSAQRDAHEKRKGAFPWHEMTDRDRRMITAAYWAMCDHIDVQVGRMLDALDRTGQRDKTIVIFTSDHGEMLGDHGLYTKGPYFYEGAIRVPLIVSMPGTIAPGGRAGGLVELIDLAPTLLDAVGLPRGPGMQAQSLWPALTGQVDLDALRDDVYCEYYNAMPGRHFATMIRTASHKLVVIHGTGGREGELYDLRADPTESRNLWHDPAHASVKTDLLVRLSDRMAQTADPLPPRIGVF